MRAKLRLAFGMIAALGLSMGLAACHTTAGVGQDLSQGGHALTDSANNNAPKSPSP
ncbi:entericidin A/B family lipoprotein [Acidocella sp.]|uniref:entericidin A/B family lipoprotein n=1 Tax=Acidocella sp. TaxID=50710 RepID=UPI00262A9742|nr:entericidin A/B family lipoprotein [Acidocella sp.]